MKHRIQLIDYLKELNLPLNVAEVGVAEGRFSFDILSKGVNMLFLVDNWGYIESQTGDGNFCQEWHEKNLSDCIERLKEFKNAIYLRGLSHKMAMSIPDNSLGLVYLDAAHDYQNVKNDLRAWLPKLVDGGIMAGHDYLNRAYGVEKAVDEFCKGKYKVNVIHENNPDDASFYFIKKNYADTI